MNDETPRPENEPPASANERLKRRILIVDDSSAGRELLVNMFKDTFIIDTADDGNSALIRLRRYGAGISAVLLDLVMPGMDGFAVLEKMRSSSEMQSIPVIVVSGIDEKETSLRAIRDGASDFVTKPVDPDLLRLRVESAVSKAENERLRAQNSLLSLQNHEIARYRAVIDSDGTVMAEYDPESGAFTYDRAMQLYLAGKFDGRPLWDILRRDNEAEEADVAALEKLTSELAGDASRVLETLSVPLKTPSGAAHLFRVKIIRCANGQTPGTLIFTFTDIDI